MKKQGSKVKRSASTIVFDTVNLIFLLLVITVILYPLIYIISSSFSSTDAVLGGKVWLWPVEPTLNAYKVAFDYGKIWSGYYNSFIYTVLGTVVGVLVTTFAAYPLSIRNLPGKRFISMIFLFTMLFGGGMIPTYLLVKELHMLNSIWAMILPGAVSAWNIIVMRTYFENTIPQELYEAAELDGCSSFGIFWRIVLPLSGAIVAVVALFFAVSLWNSYFSALIYLSDDKMYPLQIVLRDILILNDMEMSSGADVALIEAQQGLANVLRYVLIVIATLPLLIVYPFVQKFFVKGVMIGSVKG